MSKTIEEAASAFAVKNVPHIENMVYDSDEASIVDYIADKAAEFAKGILSHQWRSVEDELPEDDDTVFVSDENGYHIASYFNGEWYSSDDEFTRNPQMWMPIPSLNPEQL